MARLVGDVGGTNTRFALFLDSGSDTDPSGPPGVSAEPAIQRIYPSDDSPDFGVLLRRFLDEVAGALPGQTVERACFGVAGPVRDGICRATNLPFVIDRGELRKELGTDKVVVVNDFALQSRAALALGPQDWVELGGREARPDGPIAVLGPGTGLGVGYAVPIPGGGFEIRASEGGHQEFAPKNDRERLVYDELRGTYGRVSVERVASGPGLETIARVLCLSDDWPLAERQSALEAIKTSDDAPRLIGEAGAGLIRTDGLPVAGSPIFRAALELFADVLGSFAGDTALLLLSEGGVYLAGGIPPRIVEFLQQSRLRESFEDKGRFSALLERIPIRLVTRADPGLLGALWFTEDL
ncbi:MAG: glucokinase [Planctomycetota bacterium]